MPPLFACGERANGVSEVGGFERDWGEDWRVLPRRSRMRGGAAAASGWSAQTRMTAPRHSPGLLECCRYRHEPSYWWMGWLFLGTCAGRGADHDPIDGLNGTAQRDYTNRMEARGAMCDGGEATPLGHEPPDVDWATRSMLAQMQPHCCPASL